ncbi:hypothetical protein vseg_014023 [Gypsophila vaccaria]
MNFNIQDMNHLRNRVDVDNDDGVEENLLGRKFYDCVFCQRGFTTAQALGGHMNIHRKDKITPTTIIINKPSHGTTVDNKSSDKGLMLLEDSNSNSNNNNNNEVNNSKRSLFSSKSYISAHQYYGHGGMSSSEGHFGHFRNPDNKWVRGRGCIDPSEEGVDLELRLGHRPW